MGWLTFLNPAFLWGALAASVPVIIHLINRRRARVVPFPTVKFVLRSERRVARKIDPRPFVEGDDETRRRSEVRAVGSAAAVDRLHHCDVDSRYVLTTADVHRPQVLHPLPLEPGAELGRPDDGGAGVARDSCRIFAMI